MGADCKFTGTNLHFLIGVMEHAKEFHKQKIYFLQAVLRNRAILPRFRFRFPNFLSTVPVPAPVPVPVPTLKF